MKKLAYITALTILACSLCACGGKNNTSVDNTEVTEATEVSVDNFSTEMFIEDATEATIVEMP